MTPPKPAGKIPRLPGHQLLLPPPFHCGKVQAALVPRKPPGKCLAALRIMLASADSLSWVQGWRKIVSQKSSLKKRGKYPQLKCLHRQNGGGKSSTGAQLRIRIPLRRGREGRRLCHPRAVHAHLTLSAPMMLGSPSFLTGSGFSRGQVLVLLLEHACSSWMRGLPQPPRVNLPSVSCPSLPTLCPDSPFYFALI